MLLKMLRTLAKICHFCLKKQTITWQLTNSTKFGNIKLLKKIRRRSKIVEDNTADELQQMYYNKNRTGEGKTKFNLSLKHICLSPRCNVFSSS